MINQLQTIETKFKELRNGYRNWVSKQSFPLEATAKRIMKRIRKKEEDVQTRMASGFGAGVMLGIMMPEADPSVAVNAIVLGVVGALVGAGMFQLGQKTSQSPGDYARTRCMLSDLGLQNYERNFKKGFLTDITMHLLTDRQVLLGKFISPVVIFCMFVASTKMMTTFFICLHLLQCS
ncbi:hypothetical protein MKW94_021880 [Papaver nudicaule]|uniref:Uncharacterized protein n=1 Tax=Papaver nudicaule TaxID=74823 RepID=A0AA41S9G6_PAPNU|nr:hypothetical protein [Papaver nudicaule]